MYLMFNFRQKLKTKKCCNTATGMPNIDFVTRESWKEFVFVLS